MATVGEVRTVHPFAVHLELAYAPDALIADVIRIPMGYRVDVRASSFVADVAILANRAAPDAVVDDRLVPLPAGEARSFVERTTAQFDPTELASPPRLRSVPGALAQVAQGPAPWGIDD